MDNLQIPLRKGLSMHIFVYTRIICTDEKCAHVDTYRFDQLLDGTIIPAAQALVRLPITHCVRVLRGMRI